MVRFHHSASIANAAAMAARGELWRMIGGYLRDGYIIRWGCENPIVQTNRSATAI